MAEKSIQSDIFRDLNSYKDTRVFRNNVGQGWCGKLIDDPKYICYLATNHPNEIVVLKNPRPVRFGLQVGSGDLIGMQSKIITPEMLNQRVAIFLSVETKTDIGSVSPEQKNWAEFVRSFGGIAGVARSVDDAISLTNQIPGL